MDAFNPIPTPVLDWMESTWLNTFMLDYAWTWVICETLHFLGMCMLFGPLIVMDLRLLGFNRLILPAPSVHVLAPLALAGFVINVGTGIMFLFGNPYRYAINVSFQIKMTLVLLAGLNAIYFWQRASRVLETAEPDDALPLRIKALGLSSLLLWTGVLCFGRLIPYLGTG